MTANRSGPSLLLAAYFSISCGGTSPTPAAPPTLPTSVTITTTPSTPAIAGITQVTLQASTTGPVDPTLTYTWDFGDGTSGTGVTTSHVFPRAGVFPVRVTVANSAAASMAATASVEARSLAGLWEPSFFVSFCFRIRITHEGSAISMVTTNGSAIAASVSHPRNITLSIAAAANFNCGGLQNLSGSFDAALDSFTLGVGVSQTDTWRRLPN